MAYYEEASPICRGKNLSWETVLLFYNNMPRTAMPKADFNAYVESRINGWTQTHSQIARQLAFYYEQDGMCYPRFTEGTTYSDLFLYMQNWASKYFVPNPYAPSLKAYEPVCIYLFLKNSIEQGNTDFDAALDSIFDVKLNSHDKVNVYLSNFTNIVIGSNHQMRINDRIDFPEVKQEVLDDYVSDAKKYFDYFTIRTHETVKSPSSNLSRQIIYYGAPGTGKSHGIKKQLAGVSAENIFRTTFHPDSDYSTFVGAYKPTMKESQSKLLSKAELIGRLAAMKKNGITYPCQKFGAEYWDSLQELETTELKEIIELCGFTEAYYQEVNKGIAVGQELISKEKESKIAYSFIAQTFLQAYIRAYKTDEPVYLIIEEINRGNCAQIFGDLFQLLDRDEDGKSDYKIKADADLRAFLEKELGGESDGIKGGELCLPSNLYILATMNTSDQSLFPIDSAFKRRWDWKYMKIKDAKKGWKIDVEMKEGEKQDWWAFVEQINRVIANMTSSADKQLGYFFCKADKKADETEVEPTIISAETFVSKVVFYLWNDVFKDYGFEDDRLFKYKKTDEDGNETEEDLTFPAFYKDDDENSVDVDVVKQFIRNVMDWKAEETGKE